jgi:hypothetical protein
MHQTADEEVLHSRDMVEQAEVFPYLSASKVEDEHL